MKTVTTWILIANGTQARILAQTGAGHALQSVDELCAVDPGMRTAKDNADRPGRSFDSVGAGRHSMEASSDPLARAKSNFAERLSDYLEKCHGQEKFDRLIVVAAPAMLGNIRKALSKKLDVYRELPKDLTQISIENMPDHLDELLAV